MLMAMNQAINISNSQSDYSSLYTLEVSQQPIKARLCSFKEKVDRRPIDPPPIVKLSSNSSNDNFLQNPYFFLYATLTDESGKDDLYCVNNNNPTAGAVVQSLHKLKDLRNNDCGFFVFSDISVRLEGFFRLKFTLFCMEGESVRQLCSTQSNIFCVYSPKSFPGMSESTELTKCLSDQGVRIRIRKEPRRALTSFKGKRRQEETEESMEEDGYSPHDAYVEPHKKRSPIYSAGSSTTLQFHSSAYPPLGSSLITRQSTHLPPPSIKSSAMSVQNILSGNNQDSPLYHASPSPLDCKENRLLATRKLPLPSCLSKIPESTTNDPPPTRPNDLDTLLNSDQQVYSSNCYSHPFSHLRK
ncbi:velvet factor-domain-containing protein [Sporodiniella umbellata]|nr:velvet factor-domain-containing protein [Sporodiniella umbellata]